MSDKPFSIKSSFVKPIVTVVFPNGGEKLQKGKKYNIRWQASSFIKSVTIFLTSPGPSYMVVDNTPNDGIYEWTIPEKIPIDSYYQITVDLKTGIMEDRDSSDAIFSIIQ